MILDSLLWVVFRFSRFRTYVLKRPGVKQLLRNPRRILLTRLQNVGDMIVFLPTIRAFRRGYPEAEIRLLVKHPGGVEIVEGCPDLDGLIRVRGKGLKNKIRLIREIRNFRPDLFVISTQDYGRVPWGVMGGAKVLVGYEKVLLGSVWKREKLPSLFYRSPSFDPEETELRRNLKLAEACGIDDPDPVARYDWFGADDLRKADRLLEELAGPGPLVVMSPGTKRPSRRWMEDRFAEVADTLVKDHRVRLCWIGSEEEKGLIESIRAKMRQGSISLAGQTTLRELPAFLRRVDFLITVDSGPMHIAAAVGLPFVALFGPGEFAKWRHDSDPLRQRNICVGAECAPCYRYDCDDHRCMKGITVSAVLHEVDTVLKLLKQNVAGEAR
ncbi:MAG: glycosyltransferase family 9 protein [Deltaproteobacteria bacterium]|nr:glycosyltransferase family 9 protein [Deltaproteobacteria bacterium]